VIGGYLIYSQETGYSTTNFKDEMIDKLEKSVDESTSGY